MYLDNDDFWKKHEPDILEIVKSKLEHNTYTMSCYVTTGDMYGEMKEHLKLLCEELEKTKLEVVDAYHEGYSDCLEFQ